MEYVIDCAEWNKERILEIFSELPDSVYTKIVLYTEAIKLVLSLIAIPKVLLPRSNPKHLILNTHSSSFLKLSFYLL